MKVLSNQCSGQRYGARFRSFATLVLSKRPGGRISSTPGALLEAKTTKKLPKRYVYNGFWVFCERRTPKRSDEPCDILLVEDLEKWKNACHAKVEISMLQSVSRASTKNRVLTLDALELRLPMFQRCTASTPGSLLEAKTTKKLPKRYVYN